MMSHLDIDQPLGNHTDRFTAARERLELVVSIDLYLGETAAMADYVLPATDSMEHSDFPVGWMDLQVTPYAQFTPAVVPAAPGR
ncbi:MAG: molybdopterin-dependent oxidoreductase, partial [Ilumatobacteraceae bacterium]